MSEYVLEMQEITKVFSGNTVLDKVELKVRSGEVHALMGESTRKTAEKCSWMEDK